MREVLAFGTLEALFKRMTYPSTRRLSVYDREAAAYVQRLGVKVVAVVLKRLLNSRSPEKDNSGGFFFCAGVKT